MWTRMPQWNHQSTPRISFLVQQRFLLSYSSELKLIFLYVGAQEILRNNKNLLKFKIYNSTGLIMHKQNSLPIGWLQTSPKYMDKGLGLWCLTPLSTNFSYIVAVSFIDGGDWSTRRKQQTCRKSLTNYHIMLYWVQLTMNRVRTHNFSGDRHWLHM